MKQTELLSELQKFKDRIAQLRSADPVDSAELQSIADKLVRLSCQVADGWSDQAVAAAERSERFQNLRRQLAASGNLPRLVHTEGNITRILKIPTARLGRSQFVETLDDLLLSVEELISFVLENSPPDLPDTTK